MTVGPIDTAYVEIKPETGGFASDLKRDLDAAFRQIERVVKESTADIGRHFAKSGEEIEDTFKETSRAAKREYDKVEKEAKQATKQSSGHFKGMFSVIAGGFLAIGGINMFGGFLEGARESIKIGKLTAQVIETTGAASWITAGQVSDLADTLSQLTGIDDEVIQSTENVLLTFTNVRNEVGKGNDIFSQATAIAQDMSVALGQDATSSAIQLGKALNDPIKGITALTRVGVTFTDQQKEQIKTLVESGDKLGAQKIILAELLTEYGGAAEAAATPWDKLKVSLGNVGEKIGTVLVPKLDALAGWLTETGIPAFEGFVDFIKVDFIPDVVKLFTGIKDKLPDIDLSGIAKSFTEQAKKWGGALIDGLRKGLDTGDWRPLGETVGKGILKAVEAAGKFVGDIVDKISEWFGKVDWLGVGIELGKQLGPLAIGILVGIANIDLWELIKDIADHWKEVLFAALLLAFTPAKVLKFVSDLLRKIPLAGPIVSWVFDGLATASKFVVSHVFEFMGRFIGAFLEGLTGGNAGRVASGVSGFVSRMAGWVIEGIPKLIAAAGRMMSGFADGIIAWAGRLGELGNRVLGWLAKPFEGAYHWLVQAGKNIIQGLWDGLLFVWQKVKDWVGGIGDWIKDHKGPLSVDRQLLFPAGVGLMEGFLRGLKSGAGPAWDFVKSVGGKTMSMLQGIFSVFGGGGGGGAPGNLSAMQQLVKGMAAARGWVGGQWDALYKLVMGESGFRNTAQNPTSSAYGLFQFLDSTWGSVGYRKTSDPAVQTAAGLKYIANRYGTPANAYAKWLSRHPHWYGEGGLITEPVLGTGLRSGRSYGFGEKGTEVVLPHKLLSFDIGGLVPRTGLGMLHAGEAVINPKFPSRARDILSRVDADQAVGKAGGGTTINITVNVAGSVTSEHDLARTILDELAQLERRSDLEFRLNSRRVARSGMVTS